MFPEELASHNYLRLVSMAKTKCNLYIGPKLSVMLDQVIDDCEHQQLRRAQLSLRNIKVFLRLVGALPFAKPLTAEDLIENIQLNRVVLQTALKEARAGDNVAEIAEIQEALQANEACAQALR